MGSCSHKHAAVLLHRINPFLLNNLANTPLTYIYTHTQKYTKRATGENISIQIFWSSAGIQLKCPLLRNTQKSVTCPNNPFLYKLFGLTKKELFSSGGLCTTLKIYKVYGSSHWLHLWKWSSLRRTRESLKVKLTKLKIFSLFFSQKFLLPPPDFKTGFSLLPNVNFNHIFLEHIKKPLQNISFTENTVHRKYLVLFAHKVSHHSPS